MAYVLHLLVCSLTVQLQIAFLSKGAFPQLRSCWIVQQLEFYICRRDFTLDKGLILVKVEFL